MYTAKQIQAIKELKKKYSVKNVSTFNGREEYGFNATLYENNKKLCNVNDDTCGAPYNFSDYSVQRKLIIELKEKVGSFKYSENDDFELDYDAEIFVYELVNEFLENKKYKNKCKNKTLIVKTDCKEGEFYSYNVKYNESVAKQLRAKFGKDLVEIINERFI